MGEFNENLWAPWRMEYIRSLAEEAKSEGCFLCRYWTDPSSDRQNRVVWRTSRTFVVMNRFPYTNGHLLVALAEHVAGIDDIEPDTLTEMTFAVRDTVRVLRAAIKPQGFNVGYNIGHCAGAGLPGHLHAHVVPRWSGDTNFMAVLGNVRTIPDALNALYDELAKAAESLGLRASK